MHFLGSFILLIVLYIAQHVVLLTLKIFCQAVH